MKGRKLMGYRVLTTLLFIKKSVVFVLVGKILLFARCVWFGGTVVTVVYFICSFRSGCSYTCGLFTTTK